MGRTKAFHTPPPDTPLLLGLRQPVVNLGLVATSQVAIPYVETNEGKFTPTWYNRVIFPRNDHSGREAMDDPTFPRSCCS